MPDNRQIPDFVESVPRFERFTGRVTQIENMESGESEYGCTKYVLVEGTDGQMVYFIMTPFTYFVDHEKIDTGSIIHVFYNADAPALMIYPPQLEAVAVALDKPGQNVTVDFFDDQLISMDGSLQVVVGRNTEVVSENGQDFKGRITFRPLVVVYGATTRSIPAQTTAEQIIVMCRY